MNFLAHLFLSGNDKDILVGNLLGDFVKGRLEGNYPARIEEGIMFHRNIDSFSGRNLHFVRSKRRIDESFGHYRGVLVDLFYDHFLAKSWPEYGEIAFPEYLSNTQLIIEEYRNYLPERLRNSIQYIFSELLPSYLEIDGISRSLVRMATRSARPNRLGEGGEELKRLYIPLQDDFQNFFPELRAFAGEWKGPVNRI
jgi:acyl carrier protein phosphodiesterase